MSYLATLLAADVIHHPWQIN